MLELGTEPFRTGLYKKKHRECGRISGTQGQSTDEAGETFRGRQRIGTYICGFVFEFELGG